MPNVTGGKTTDGASVEPVEIHGAHELFCDALVAERFGETVRLYLRRAVSPVGGKADLIAVVHMPSGSFDSALRRLVAEFLVKKPDGH